MLHFELRKTEDHARRGRLTLNHGVVETPVSTPVGAYGAVKGVMPRLLEEMGAQIILGHTFHLWLRPGLELWGQLMTLEARSAEEFGPAYGRMARKGVQGILGTADGAHLFRLRAAMVGHAARVVIPAMYVDERYIEAGGLVSYGTDNVDQTRRGAPYVDNILRGAKLADLLVEEPTKFRMAVNLKTARALKIAIPQSILARLFQRSPDPTQRHALDQRSTERPV